MGNWVGAPAVQAPLVALQVFFALVVYLLADQQKRRADDTAGTLSSSPKVERCRSNCLHAQESRDVRPVGVHPEPDGAEQGVHVDHTSQLQRQRQEGEDAGMGQDDGVGHGVGLGLRLDDRVDYGPELGLEDGDNQAQEDRSDRVLHAGEGVQEVCTGWIRMRPKVVRPKERTRGRNPAMLCRAIKKIKNDAPMGCRPGRTGLRRPYDNAGRVKTV